MSDDRAIPIQTAQTADGRIVRPALANWGLPERYVRIEEIGSGGMGVVLKAHDNELDQELAIKILIADSGPDRIQRFMREAKTLAKLNHKNIIAIRSFGVTSDGKPYHVSELLEGRTLQERLREGALPAYEFKSIFTQIIAALEYARSNGVVHRDIKPSNIFLCRTTDKEQLVKILDFGIARLETQQGETTRALTGTSVALGSPLYMSPEQCRGDRVDHLSDIYSLGCVMFECVAGKPPFQGETPMETMYQHLTAQPPAIESKDTSVSALAQVISSCLAKAPEHRPQTYDQVQTQLDQTIANVRDSLAISASPASAKKSKAIWMPVLLVLLVMLCGGAVLLYTGGKRNPAKITAPQHVIITNLRSKLERQKKIYDASTAVDKITGATHVAEYAIDLGNMLNNQHRYAEALDAYRQSLNVSLTDDGVHRLYSGKALTAIAKIQLSQADELKDASKREEALQSIKQAEERLDKAFWNSREGPMKICAARIHAKLVRAVICEAQGNFSECRKLVSECGPMTDDLERMTPPGLMGSKIINPFKREASMDAQKLFRKYGPLAKGPQDHLDLAAIHLFGVKYMSARKEYGCAKTLLAWTDEELAKAESAELPEFQAVKQEALASHKVVDGRPD